ncbi:MAG: LAGLIDADG family homing endonuclease [Methanomassiliicoccus sp.]|nr:LAGLIDADG family homing endonuclease [Methanomassiliicoccus sp.]
MAGQEDEGYDTVMNGATGEEPRDEKLRPGVDVSVISKWEAFFQGTEYMQKVREVADLYPEVRSVNVQYDDLDRFDADLAAGLLEHPDLYLLAGKQAIKNLMHQDMRRAGVNLRILALPRDSRVEIRELRAKHVGKLVSVEGLVRKATEVRPKITDALFQCLRCGHVIREAQEGLFFKEPMECYKEQDGCGRSAGSTKFKLLTEESRFVDTQKVEVQESPEGLRGGAQPERLTGYLEDDAAGSVAPGDRITLNGILRSVQKGQPAKSTLFDINLDIIAAESQRHEYEEIQISEEDEKQIIEVAHSPDVFKKIVASISPTIYGYDVEKESLALQLFGGVPKKLDDGTRIRGDIHILLIGDPGVAKCCVGDTDIGMPDGSTRKIRDVVEDILAKSEAEKIDDGVTAAADLDVLTFSMRGRMEGGRCVRVWKRTAPEKMLRITTEKGRTLIVTPTHPLFVQNGPRIRPVEACCLNVGRPIAVSTGLFKQWNADNFGFDCGFDLDPIASKEEIFPPEEWVYDLEVEHSHNYIANGIVSHNSQMLRYMSRLAPRGIYASGKSSSAAGLCVAPDTCIEVDGDEVPIGEFVEKRMSAPVEARPGQWRDAVTEVSNVATVSDRRQVLKTVETVWRIKTPPFLVEIRESSGRRLTLTPETKLWCMPESSHDGWREASEVEIGEKVLVRDASTGNFRWSTVEEVREVTDSLPSHVYDLTVSGTHSFVANGFVVHNTAAAVKDDFGEGRWTLEAGALVLADKGAACVDEMDKMTDQDRSSMHEAMESQCYDEQTEILTSNGWKYFKDVEKDDLVASLSSEGELVFVQPTQYVDAEYEGEMYYIEGRQVNLAVTPNHNMYVSINKRADEWHPFRLQRMDGLPIGKKMKFRRNATWNGEEKEMFDLPRVEKYGNQARVPRISSKQFEMDDWLEFLGYFISEGSVQKANGIPHRVHITQTKDPNKVEKIGKCIERLGYKASYDGHNFAISDKQLANYLAPLGKCHEKYIPREYLQLSSRQLLILFEALMLGDGYHRKTTGHREYGTSSKKLADGVQELALKIGISANIKVVLPGRYSSRLNGRKIEYAVPHYVVSLIDGYRRNMNEPMINTSPSRKNIFKVQYSGRIYCVEVPNHVLYVRRNGKPVWCGNTVSVAKAGITATLQCRCSLLGAANPKYGRFQEHQYIAEQINMPPALLSRFDLIFAMTDKPSADRDASITQHILRSHRRGQILKYEDPAAVQGVDAEKIMSDTTAMLPALDRDFFRKYVAYSKKINPILSDEAMAIISQYYLKIRKQGEGEGASVPITARQLEAFVRLSEASARARLSTLVEADDAQRAVRIVEYYLRRIAGEGDKLDFDIIATGTSHSQREQIGILKKLVSGLAKNAEFKKGVPAEEIYKSAMAEGITEDRAKTLLKRLAQNGEIYSPSPGHYRLASEG